MRVDTGSNGAVAGIDTDADGFDRIAFGTVDMGAYEVFVDCNTNDLADVAELMDANTNGVVDLEDFQKFQLCLGDTGAVCLGVFDRALACGIVDVDDFVVFEDQLAGPAGTTGGGEPQAKVLMSPKKRKTGGAWYAKVLDGSPDIETAALTFELQPVGGGEAVTTLAPHTAYELHYTAHKGGTVTYYVPVKRRRWRVVRVVWVRMVAERSLLGCAFAIAVGTWSPGLLKVFCWLRSVAARVAEEHQGVVRQAAERAAV